MYINDNVSFYMYFYLYIHICLCMYLFICTMDATYIEFNQSLGTLGAARRRDVDTHGESCVTGFRWS